MKTVSFLFLAILIWTSCQRNSESQQVFDFQTETTPSGQACVFPSLHATEDGQLLMSWIHEEDTLSHLMLASLKNGQWSRPLEVAQGSNWFVNWADFPNVLAMPDGRWLTFYLPIYDPESYGYNIAVHQSKDAGQSWNEPIALYRDVPNTTQGFVSFFPIGDNTGAIWLEALPMEGASAAHHDHDHDMVVRYAAIDADGKLSDEQVLDDYVCTCCQTDAVAVPGGAIAVYRDRSKDEIRDISYVRLQNGQWSQPKTLHEDNWQIKACPVNGPAIDAFGNTVAVAWYTMPDSEGKVWLSFSQNAGETFDPPVQIDLGKPMGRVDVLMLDAERALVSWVEKAEGSGSLNIKMVQKDGSILASQQVSPFEPVRPAGFPRMAKVGDKIFIAWTEGAAEDAVIKMMSAKIPADEI